MIIVIVRCVITLPCRSSGAHGVDAAEDVHRAAALVVAVDLGDFILLYNIIIHQYIYIYIYVYIHTHTHTYTYSTFYI